MAKKSAISPRREENYPAWYQQVVKTADLAESSDVRGCMVIKPWGFAIWENMKAVLNKMFKETGHKNAYFPLFIPKSYLEKEAEHVQGFAKECAVVTHSRLQQVDGKLIPRGKLTQELIIRPTSETIIGSSFSKWISSYRDLPLLINQWANIIRWEMRPRLFLRTTEFLWQEGHTVHQTKDEALAHTHKMLGVYTDFVQNWLAIPVLCGKKSESEKFPGAVKTLCLEAMMQDRKALQMGTSHFLGQNFAKASGIKFQDKDGSVRYGWTTSWGVSTRMIGGLIMTHSDDDGLVLPPAIAPSHIVFISIFKNSDEKKQIADRLRPIIKSLKKQKFMGRELSIEFDQSETTFGSRRWNWIKKGIPLRVEVGTKELEKGVFAVCRRDLPSYEKTTLGEEDFTQQIPDILKKMQDDIFAKAKTYRENNTTNVENKEEFYQIFTPLNKKNPEIHGKFAKSFWCGSRACEQKIKQDLSVTIRLIPFGDGNEQGKCICCGKQASKRVIFAKAY